MVQTVKARRNLQSVKSAKSPSATGKSATPKVAETNARAVAKIKSTTPRDDSLSQGKQTVRSEAHNLGTAGSTPAPATDHNWPFANRVPIFEERPVIPQPPPLKRGDDSMQMLVYALAALVVVICIAWAWLG